MDDIVTALRQTGSRAVLPVRRRHDEKVDRVLAVPVDERGDRTLIEVVETAADEGIAVGGEIVDRRRDIEPAMKPRLHRVLVR